MTNTEGQLEGQTLRQRAEAIARTRADLPPTQLEALSPEALQELVHELRLHQIELETQNEELRRTQIALEDARERYFNLYDLAPVGYCTLSQQGRIVHATLTAARLLGRTRDLLMQQPLTRYISQSDQDIYYLHRKKLLESHHPQSCELRILKEDGTQIWVHLAETILKDVGGEPICHVVLSDVTGRKLLQIQSEYERSVLELVATGSPLKEVMDRIVLGYEALWPGLRGSVSLLNGLRLQNLTAPSLPPAYCQAIDGLEIGPATGSCGTAAYTGKRVVVANIARDPNWQDLKQLALAHGLQACWSVPMLGSSGQVLGTLAYYPDPPRDALPLEIETMERAAYLGSLAIQRDQTEAVLRATEARTQLLIEAANVGLWEWDLISNEIYFSPEWKAQLGYAKHELPSRIEEWKSRLHPADLQVTMAAVQNCREGHRSSCDIEFRLRHKDGSWRWILSQVNLVRNAAGQAERMRGSHIDITRRRQAEDALCVSEERFKNAFQYSNIGMALTSPKGLIVQVNSRACHLLGYSESELSGMTIQDVTHPDDRDTDLRRQEQMVSGKLEAYTATKRYIHKHGQVVWALSATALVKDRTGHFAGLVWQISDMTEHRRAEEQRSQLEAQLHQAMKMQSVGRLAGGVAHDFNNMLGVILGHADLALGQLEPTQPSHGHLLEIREAARRSADLTGQLLAFASKQTVSPRPLDLNETIVNSLRMLRRLIGEDIQVTWRPADNLWLIKMDPSQLDQILTNLCINARDSISDVGRIDLSTTNHGIEADYCAGNADALPGDYVRLSVNDNGCGMDKETLAQIFEPFFTTKNVATSTGLGLATVYGNVRQNRGFINVTSQPGRGTTFDIYLPRHRGEAGPSPQIPASKSDVRGQETILLVEDEPAILKLATRMLEAYGYTVLTANSPRRAIQIASEHAHLLDLLVTDVVMPEMNGRDLANTLATHCPRLKRLFMSGYPADVIAHHGLLDDGVFFIQKPFSSDSLASKVRQALDSP
ncbi:PAS domain S-box protein [bacterium]|nr:PAS domain S-box protein [bacterium]